MRACTLLALLIATVGAHAEEVSFASVDVFVQSDAPLAAWQFELSDRNATMQIVGVENGESSAYRDAPYYDREAVNLGRADRIIVADYSLAQTNQLPSGRVRVATLHLMLTAAQTPAYQISLIAAAGPDGEPLDASISIEPTARNQP